MALLSRSARDPALVSIQCDVCIPPTVATTLEGLLRGAGWRTTADGAALDVCPRCAPALRWVRRADPRPVRDGSTGRRPNLVVIGAAKCGTTTLHSHLATHPDIAMSDPKELQFFQDPRCGDWLRRYASYFDDDAAVVGESSTMYTRAPALPGVPGRLAAMAPDARLIYMVRDPVERALASYWEERFQLLDARSLDEAFADLEDPFNPYVAGSRYADQLGGYLEHFPAEQILVLTLDELRDSPQQTLQRVFRFLDVDAAHAVDGTRRDNEAAAKFEYGGLGLRLRATVGATVVRRLPPKVRGRARATIQRVLARPLERPTPSADVVLGLKQALAEDARRFREMTGLTVADWSV